MLLTNHVLSGALIGARSRGPGQAFAAGVASHFVLDAIPHWGEWGSKRRFLQVAVTDGLVSLAVAGALVAAAPPARRAAVLAGMAGAALPDADKPDWLSKLDIKEMKIDWDLMSQKQTDWMNYWSQNIKDKGGR